MFYWDNAIAYPCIRSSLKEVEIKGFRGNTNELCMLNYLIGRGRNLKKMSIDIHVVGDDKEMFFRRQAARLMQRIGRASRDLEISIC